MVFHQSYLMVDRIHDRPNRLVDEEGRAERAERAEKAHDGKIFGEKLVAVSASLLLAGLTITCSLSLNNMMNAWFNYTFPEPHADELYKRFTYRLFFFVIILIFVAIVVVIVTNHSKAKQSLIDLEDFAQGSNI